MGSGSKCPPAQCLGTRCPCHRHAGESCNAQAAEHPLQSHVGVCAPTNRMLGGVLAPFLRLRLHLDLAPSLQPFQHGTLFFPLLLRHELVLVEEVAAFANLSAVHGLVHERANGFERRVRAVLLLGHLLWPGLLHRIHNESCSLEAHCKVERRLQEQRIHNPHLLALPVHSHHKRVAAGLGGDEAPFIAGVVVRHRKIGHVARAPCEQPARAPHGPLQLVQRPPLFHIIVRGIVGSLQLPVPLRARGGAHAGDPVDASCGKRHRSLPF